MMQICTNENPTYTHTFFEWAITITADHQPRRLRAHDDEDTWNLFRKTAEGQVTSMIKTATLTVRCSLFLSALDTVPNQAIIGRLMNVCHGIMDKCHEFVTRPKKQFRALVAGLCKRLPRCFHRVLLSYSYHRARFIIWPLMTVWVSFLLKSTHLSFWLHLKHLLVR